MKRFTLFLFLVGFFNTIHASSFTPQIAFDFFETVKSSLSIIRSDLYNSFFSSPLILRPSLVHLQQFAWIVEQPYVVVDNNRNNDFSLNLAQEMYGISAEDCKRKRAAITERMKQIFYTSHQEEEDGIPLNTHRMWITSRDYPNEAPSERLDIYLKSLKKLKSSDWTHHFWCIKKADIPETIKILQGSEVPVLIHELEEISPEMSIQFIFDAYYEDRQFCIASDVARQVVVYLYGGIYSDLGADFSTDIAPLLKEYDYIFWYNGHYLDQTFFGYKKHDPIAKKFLDNLSTLYMMPEKIKALTRDQEWRSQIWSSGAHFMTLFDVFSTPQHRFLFVPEGPKSLIQINHAGSWFGKGTSGNKTIAESKLDIMNLQPAKKQ